MNAKIAAEIQAEQDHGRSKYGHGPNDFEHDDATPDIIWHGCILDHNDRAAHSTPMERRQHLVKVAGLAVSAIESFDRSRIPTNHPEDYCQLCGGQNSCWFAPNELWNLYHGKWNILCPTCFAMLAKTAGFDPAWKLEPENHNPNRKHEVHISRSPCPTCDVPPKASLVGPSDFEKATGLLFPK